MSTDTPPPAAAVKEDTTVALLAYITLIGFIIAIIMHGNKKTALGAYHLRQALGLFITAFIGGIVLAIIPVVGWLLLPFFWLTVIIFAVLGIMAAVGGKQKPLPVLGTKYEQWFSGAFA
jgi:uncharacterized membrane protein